MEGWGRLGEALAQHDGQPVFVFGGIPGEEVEVEVIRHRRKHVAARVVRVLDASPHRTEAPCPYFGRCTGCQLQHIQYDHVLELKRETVVDALSRVGHFDDPPVSDTVPAPHQYGYRNHARFTVGAEGSLGFVNRESRQFVSINSCILMDPWINGALQQLQGRCSETTQVAIRHGAGADDYLIQPTLKADTGSLATGQKHFHEVLNDKSFRVASPSFFQVNTLQATRLVELVSSALNLSGNEFIVDAYAGVGTFAVLLAPMCRRVIAIEESSSAVEDARVNAAGIENLEIRQEKTEAAMEEITDQPDGVILDPPRAGCHSRVLEALSRLRPQKIVYVSCDPPTLGRDLRALCNGPFVLEQVQPIDMFPQTHHVECVATLRLKDQAPAEEGQELMLASSSPRRSNILSSLGIGFRVTHPQIDESPAPGEGPHELVGRLALAKAQNVAAGLRHGLVIGADSVVVSEGKVLGKPPTDDEARKMLQELRGRTHQVFSGVAVVNAAQDSCNVTCRSTQVTMRDYSSQEMEDYIASGQAADKAGAYGIQDSPFSPVASIEGCYTNVVGLPLCDLLRLLGEMGYQNAVKVPSHLVEACSECPLRVRAE